MYLTTRSDRVGRFVPANYAFCGYPGTVITASRCPETLKTREGYPTVPPFMLTPICSQSCCPKSEPSKLTEQVKQDLIKKIGKIDEFIKKSPIPCSPSETINFRRTSLLSYAKLIIDENLPIDVQMFIENLLK